MDMIGDTRRLLTGKYLKTITVAAELPLRQLPMANVRRRRDHPGEPRIERRPCGAGFTVSQLGSERITVVIAFLAVMYGAAEVLRMATPTDAELLV